MSFLSWLVLVFGGVVVVTLLIRLWHRLASGRCISRRRMDGKTVIVTGSNTGIGKETALELARRGAKVILACRDIERGTAAREEIARRSGNTSVYFLQLDLSSLQSVRDFVQEVERRETRLDVLINNAAAAGMLNKKTADGLQQEMQINHFGPFLLTILLIDLLKKSAPSRIVTVSSLAHKFAKLEVDNMNNERWFSDTYQYSNTKLANVVFSNELARRLQGTGVTSNSLHPGVVRTEITRRMPSLPQAIFTFLLDIAFKNAAEGAQTSIYLAVADEVEHVTGKYFSDCKEAKVSNLALDKEFARNVWNKSAEFVKVDSNIL